MKKRILLPNGKFADFKGKREVVEIKREAQKDKERAEYVEKANQLGFKKKPV